MKVDAKTADEPLQPDEINLATLMKEIGDEDHARELLERMRWPNGPVCPHCKHDGQGKPISKLTPQAKTAETKAAVRNGVYFCGACRKQFTATVGTVFEASKVPISKWLIATFLMCASKKSMSALQLQRSLGVTYKTAWFMFHRLRHAMGDDLKVKLSGDVEADETFVGGKGVRCSTSRRKTPVLALVERGGKMKARVVSSVTQNTLGKALAECVSKSAVMHTDEHPAYKKPLQDWKAHHTVVHSKFEYSRKLADGSKTGINTCESFFSLLKRGVYGSWHCVSREHLQKYTNEFSFRWNTRFLTDGERMAEALPMIDGKRLFYRRPTA